MLALPESSHSESESRPGQLTRFKAETANLDTLSTKTVRGEEGRLQGETSCTS